MSRVRSIESLAQPVSFVTVRDRRIMNEPAPVASDVATETSIQDPIKEGKQIE